MSYLRALPFRSADPALETSIVGTSDSVEPRVDGTWDAFSAPHDGMVTIDVDITVDLSMLQSCLPPGYSAERDLELVALERSTASRRRLVLDRYGLADQQLTFDLDPELHAGKVEVLITAALRKNLSPIQGFAHLSGSTLATVDCATIWFDEPEPSLGDTLDIRWADFEKDDALPDAHMFALRMEERPVILLNSAIGYAHEILNSKGTHGAAARIRDATFMTIVHQCWSSLLSQVFMDVARLDDVDPDTVLDELGGWEGDVLRSWAPDFVPGEGDVAAATERLVRQLHESGPQLLVETLPDVLQRKFGSVRGFNGLVLESDRFGAGAGS